VKLPFLIDKPLETTTIRCKIKFCIQQRSRTQYQEKNIRVCC
jgi:hypothetical protein